MKAILFSLVIIFTLGAGAALFSMCACGDEGSGGSGDLPGCDNYCEFLGSCDPASQKPDYNGFFENGCIDDCVAYNWMNDPAVHQCYFPHH